VVVVVLVDLEQAQVMQLPLEQITLLLLVLVGLVALPVHKRVERVAISVFSTITSNRRGWWLDLAL
jgi:hypothetical protein